MISAGYAGAVITIYETRFRRHVTASEVPLSQLAHFPQTDERKLPRNHHRSNRDATPSSARMGTSPM